MAHNQEVTPPSWLWLSFKASWSLVFGGDGGPVLGAPILVLAEQLLWPVHGAHSCFCPRFPSLHAPKPTTSTSLVCALPALSLGVFRGGLSPCLSQSVAGRTP